MIKVLSKDRKTDNPEGASAQLPGNPYDREQAQLIVMALDSSHRIPYDREQAARQPENKKVPSKNHIEDTFFI